MTSALTRGTVGFKDVKAVDRLLVHRLFYPDVPAVLSAKHRGRVSAMPVVSYASLSSSPSRVGVSCASGSFTLKLVLKSKAFSLCFLDSSQLPAMEHLATHSGAGLKDKLAEAGLRHADGVAVNAPAIVGSAAVVECLLTYRRKVGDHTLIVGSVEAARASSDFKEYWRYRTYRPILYTGWKERMDVFRPSTNRT